jgi:hypothetical protein
MADKLPFKFDMPEPPSLGPSMPTPPSPADENAAIQILARAASAFLDSPIISDIPALNKAFATEKVRFQQNNLSVFSNAAIRYTTVARYLREKTLPKKGGKKTYRRSANVRKTRKHRSM